MTDTLEKVIAAAAIIKDSSRPKAKRQAVMSKATAELHRDEGPEQLLVADVAGVAGRGGESVLAER